MWLLDAEIRLQGNDAESSYPGRQDDRSAAFCSCDTELVFTCDQGT